jgi:uncharacterized protein YceK
MIKKLLTVSMVFCLIITLVGCATVIHGTKQDIGITSVPTGATVTIDGISYGTTPTIVKLARGKMHTVKIELPGYRPYETVITKDISGWVFGNIILGGLIGLAVDAFSGGLYNLSPEQIQATLASGGAKNIRTEDMLCVFVTSDPDPNWKKIGTLERIN